MRLAFRVKRGMMIWVVMVYALHCACVEHLWLQNVIEFKLVQVRLPVPRSTVSQDGARAEHAQHAQRRRNLHVPRGKYVLTAEPEDGENQGQCFTT